uniref:Peptidase S1 domain-containing protein n=1 Tax=Callorhinchus milii TaxID=7868 RepID=A0A4W3GR49_CALMI
IQHFVKLMKLFSCGEAVYKPDLNGNYDIAAPFSWPWQVSLQSKSGIAFSHICGGTLITPLWILTAGKCINYNTKYRIVLGKYDLTFTEGSEQFIDPTKIIIHPINLSHVVLHRFDIALVKLSWPVVFTDKVRLGCLPGPGEALPHNYTCVVTGWGKLNGTLLQSLLPAIDYETCSRADWWGTTVVDSMVCVGGFEKTACEGDPGGPLNCIGIDGRWYIHGVGSFIGPVNCDVPGKPTVYTRVSAFNNWLNEVSIKPYRIFETSRSSSQNVK